MKSSASSKMCGTFRRISGALVRICGTLERLCVTLGQIFSKLVKIPFVLYNQ